MSRLSFALIGMAFATLAIACNIPVFRYALERWKPDRCEIVVYHQDALTDDQQALIDSITNDPSQLPTANINVTLHDVDLEISDPSDRALRDGWKEIAKAKDVTLPYVVVRTSISPGKFVNGWSGLLEQLADDNLLKSPVRSELSQRLLAGHSVVWIVLESEDTERTDDVCQTLRKELDLLQSQAKLPDGIGLPGSELYAEVPLLVKFSILRIDPHDPKEEFLISLFRGFHPHEYAEGEPLVVPVFGRGRALEVFPAKQLTPNFMSDIVAFLSGACSCQVKEQNPGFDLLLQVDWDRELFGDADPPPPTTTGQRRQTPVLLPAPPGRR